MDSILQMMKKNMRQYGMFIALVLIMVLFQVITDGILLRPLNITNLVMQNSYVLILAIGMVLIIIAGHIDLSVGSVVAFIGAISAVLSIHMHLPTIVVFVISLAIGACIGAWQGFWVSYVKIPAFIVTLAGMLVFRGLTMLILKGESLAPFPRNFQLVSSGFIPDVFKGSSLNILTIAVGLLCTVAYIFIELNGRKKQKKYQLQTTSGPLFVARIIVIACLINVFSYIFATYEGIPYILVILIALILAYSFVMKRTTMGRQVYAIGGNANAASLSGIKTPRVTFWIFVNMGVLAALTGLIVAARLNAATPKAGTNFELDAIAACFIGGASAYGGIGTVGGAIVGALVMGVMNNGMSILGLGIDWQQTIKGLVLLLAVAFDVYNKNKAV